MPAVKTTEIYLGVLPYLAIQFLMILVVIFFPGLVTHYKTEHPAADPGSVQIEVPGFGSNGGSGTDLSLPPSFGLPPINLGGEEAPAAEPTIPAAPQSLGLPALEGLPGQHPAPNQPALGEPPRINP